MGKILIIAPAPIEGSGGVARIYNFARALAAQGHDSHVYVFNSGGHNAGQLAGQAEAYYQAEGFTLHETLDTVGGPWDLIIATRWDTPAIALKLQARRMAYLIQDYESYFNPVGDASLFAENSYMLGLHPLTYGRWLASKLARDFGNRAYHFDFASDTDTFRCDVPMERRLEQPQSLVFVYQADKTRRCPWLGVEALGIVKHFRPNVTLNFVGSNQAPSLWYDINNVGNLTIGELNALYNNSHVGLSLSSSNPSCNAFDMMAAGLPSVDLFRENNLYDVPSQGVLLAHQSAESIAEAIIHLLDNPAELLARSRAGIDFMASRSQRREVESFLAAVDAILGGDAEENDTPRLHAPVYDQPPVVARVNRNPYVDAFLRKQLPEAPRKRGWIGWKRARAGDALGYYPTRGYTAPATQGEADGTDRAADRNEKLARRAIRRLGLDPRLRASMFDAGYYLQMNPDVAAAGIDPFRHFVRYGIAEGRLPSRFFDKGWYDTQHPEQERHGLNSIAHYLVHGSLADASPNSLFDPVWYLAQYADVKSADVHPVGHFMRHGEAERRDPSAAFSTSWYARANPDVVANGMSLLVHYITYGRREGRLPRPDAQRPRPNVEPHEAEDIRPATGQLLAGEAGDVFTWTAAPGDHEPDARRPQADILDEKQRQAQVSFDVWNTIIHRRCHPDEIKLRSARFLLLNAWTDVRPEMRSPVQLMTARMKAENASAPRGDYEYRYVDAIAGWLKAVLAPSCGAARREALAVALVDHEMAAEAGSVELDENTGELIRNLGKAPIFISDFYMGSAFLEKLLGHVGVGRHFARGYASCDLFLNKRSGELFTHVLEDFQIAAADLLHIGDNPVSDLERPKVLGIKAVPYVSPIDEERNDWYAAAFHQHCQGDPAQHHRRMLALAEAAAKAPPTAGDPALYAIGCRVGLLAFGYCLNIMQDAIVRGAREVVFFAREGILFKQIYDLVAAQNPFDTDIPPSRLLYVSRRATFAPSLGRYDNEEFMRLWTMYWRQSPVAFAASLNLDPAKARAAARRAGLDPDAAVSAPWTDEGFQAFMQDRVFKDYAVGELARQREMLQHYLAQELDLEQGELLIADIGWRGTIQDNIAHLLGKPVRGHYLALFGYLNEQAGGSTKVGWLSDANAPGDYALPDQVAPIEMLFNGPGGSTIGYERRGGRIEPLREVFAAEEACVEALAPCRAGMLAIVPELARYVKMHGLMAGDLHDLNCKIAGDILARPPAALAEVFGRLEHNETFGVGAVEAMAERSFAEVVDTPPGPDLHAGLVTWLGNRWPAGMARRPAVAQWWRTAGPEALACAPAAISAAQSPAIVKATGSRVAVYVPEPMAAAGGYRTIMNMVKALVGVGFRAEIHVETLGDKGAIIEDYLGDTPATIMSGWHRQGRVPTLALATIANSADFVAREVIAGHKGYFVQDDESMFHALGDASVRAENSYARGLTHFTIGNWLTHYIGRKYGAVALPAGLGVDTGTYRLDPTVTREQALCILYQPEKARRASDMALRAAEIVKRMRPDIAIYVYGSDAPLNLACAHENLGVVSDLNALNALYNRCRAGVCLSLSNPSRIPFEMAAGGCQPIDLYRYNNVMDHLDGVSLLAYQSSDSVARAILQAFAGGGGTAETIAGRMRHRTLAWEGDALVSNIVRTLEGREDVGVKPRPTFTGSPILAALDDTPMARAFCKEHHDLANL